MNILFLNCLSAEVILNEMSEAAFRRGTKWVCEDGCKNTLCASEDGEVREFLHLVFTGYKIPSLSSVNFFQLQPYLVYSVSSNTTLEVGVNNQKASYNQFSQYWIVSRGSCEMFPVLVSDHSSADPRRCPHHDAASPTPPHPAHPPDTPLPPSKHLQGKLLGTGITHRRPIIC